MVHCARLLGWSRVFKQALSVHHDHDQSINWSHHHVPSTHTHYHQYPSRSLYWGVLVKTLHWPCLSLSPIARTFRCLSSLKRPTGWLRGLSGTTLLNWSTKLQFKSKQFTTWLEGGWQPLIIECDACVWARELFQSGTQRKMAELQKTSR